MSGGAPTRARSGSMRPLAITAVVLVGALGILTSLAPPSRELVRFECTLGRGATAAGGEALAETVHYSPPFTVTRRGTIDARLQTDHEGALVTLVGPGDSVREVEVDRRKADATFGAVRPGRYRLRVLARPTRRTRPGDTIAVTVSTGGRPWGLASAAAVVLLLPLLGLALWRRRDARATNR